MVGEERREELVDSWYATSDERCTPYVVCDVSCVKLCRGPVWVVWYQVDFSDRQREEAPTKLFLLLRSAQSSIVLYGSDLCRPGLKRAWAAVIAPRNVAKKSDGSCDHQPNASEAAHRGASQHGAGPRGWRLLQCVVTRLVENTDVWCRRVVSIPITAMR